MQQYIIFKADTLRQLDAGHAIDLGWAAGGAQGGADRYAVLQSHANYNIQVASAVDAFNKKPEQGIQQSIFDKTCNGTPEAIAKFLLKTEGLNMAKIGQYLTKRSDFNTMVLEAYVQLLDFAGCSIDQAMRIMYSSMIPPGEAQIVEKVNMMMAERFNTQNPGTYTDPENAEFVGKTARKGRLSCSQNSAFLL